MDHFFGSTLFDNTTIVRASSVGLADSSDNIQSFIGAVNITPLPDLTLGGGVSSEPGAGRRNQTAGFWGSYTWGPLTAETEFYIALSREDYVRQTETTDPATGETTTTPVRLRQSFKEKQLTFGLYYRPIEKLELGVRYTRFWDDGLATTTGVWSVRNRISLGAGWIFYEKGDISVGRVGRVPVQRPRARGRGAPDGRFRPARAVRQGVGDVQVSTCRDVGRSVMRVVRAAIVAGLAATFVLSATRDGVAQTDRADVVKTYADIGQAIYEDALARARVLQKAVRALVDAPSEADAPGGARGVALGARAVHADRGFPVRQRRRRRVGRARSTPGRSTRALIDYVEGQYGTESDSNPYYTANVIANKRLKVGSKTLDASSITKKVLRDLHEIGGVEANVATGYHAIEFLLWGQDLNGTGPGAGNRPWTDYSRTSCTHGNCDRRGQYLTAVSELLVEDLAWIARQFAPAARRGRT